MTTETPTATTTRALLGQTLADVRDLGHALYVAEDAEWAAGVNAPPSRDDTTERGKGSPPSDPTADAVGDGRRLAVRDAVRAAHTDLTTTHALLTRAHARLDAALARWEGPSV